MHVNVGPFDARLRLVLASVIFLVALLLVEALSTMTSFLLVATAIVLLATGLTRVCPLYRLLRLDSRPKVAVRR